MPRATTLLKMSSQLSFLRQSAPVKLPVEAKYTHTAVSPGSEVALQYWPRRDGSSSSPSQLTLFILGNPGLLDYYIPFLNHLQSLLPPSHAILSTSHIGHTPEYAGPRQPLDLPTQLEAKAEFIQDVRAYLDTWSQEHEQETPSPQPKLSLMGHSVGSWLMCQLMKRFPDVSAGYMLFPTVGWIANSWNGWKLWPIFTRPVKPLLPMLSPLLSPILRYTTFPPTTLSLLRSPETINACLTLAQSEMATILEPDWNWFRAQAESSDTRTGLSGIWAGGSLDGWVGKEGPLIQECLGGTDSGRVRILDKVPHAFCLTQDNSELVAETVAKLIDPSVVVPASHGPSEHSTAAETVVPM